MDVLLATKDYVDPYRTVLNLETESALTEAELTTLVESLSAGIYRVYTDTYGFELVLKSLVLEGESTRVENISRFIANGTTYKLTDGEWVLSASASTGGDVAIDYTFNGASADADGNFTVTAASVGAAASTHTHAISDVTDLQATLDGKAATTHTHDFITGITVGGDTFSDELTIVTQGELLTSVAGQVLTLTAELPTESSATALVDAADSATMKMFVGTQSEWDSFTPDANTKYIVYIHE
jgi:hypothetical protein